MTQINSYINVQHRAIKSNQSISVVHYFNYKCVKK